LKLRISEIIVGERRREDLGDIEALAKSIRQYGLLHPIVVDDKKRLVAGERRLEACKQLGWEEISVTFLGELTEEQLCEIELEENIRRKDLSEYELSKSMVELAELKKETMATPAIVLGTRGSDEGFYEGRKNPGGRPPKDRIPEKAIAEAVGVPLQTLRDAKAHVEAVEEFPELASVPKTHAIEIARQLKSVPEPLREEKRRQIKQIQEEGQRKEERIEEVYRIKKSFQQVLYGAATLKIDDDRLNAWLSNMPQADIQRQWELVEEGIANLMVLRDYFKKMFGGPRLVKLGSGKN